MAVTVSAESDITSYQFEGAVTIAFSGVTERRESHAQNSRYAQMFLCLPIKCVLCNFLFITVNYLILVYAKYIFLFQFY